MCSAAEVWNKAGVEVEWWCPVWTCLWILCSAQGTPFLSVLRDELVTSINSYLVVCHVSHWVLSPGLCICFEASASLGTQLVFLYPIHLSVRVNQVTLDGVYSLIKKNSLPGHSGWAGIGELGPGGP